MSLKIKRRNKVNPSQKFEISFSDENGHHDLILNKYCVSCSIPSKKEGEVDNYPHFILRLNYSGSSHSEEYNPSPKLLQISISTENRKEKDLINETFFNIKKVLSDPTIPTLYEKVKRIYNLSKAFDNSRVLKDSFFKNKIIEESGHKFKEDNSEYLRIKHDLPLFLAVEHLADKKYLSYEMESSETIKITFKNGATAKLGIKPTHLLTEDDLSKVHHRFFDFKKNFIKNGKYKIGYGIFNFIRYAEEMCSFDIPFGNSVNKLTFDLFGDFVFTEHYEKTIEEIKSRKVSSSFEPVVRIPRNDKYSQDYTVSSKALESEKQYIKFLSEVRGVDRVILEKMFSAGKMWVGRDFYSNNTENQDNVFIGGYEERKERPYKLFVGTSDLEKSTNIKSAEGLFFNYEMSKLEKKQLRSFDSMAFSMLSKGSPKMTFISEASIDSLSLYSLIKESDKHNVTDYNYISVMGTGNIPNWLEKNFGVTIKESLGSNNNEPIVFYVDKSLEREELEYSDKEKIRNNLKNVSFFFNKIADMKKNKNLEKEERIALKVLEDFLEFFFRNEKSNQKYKNVKILNGEIDPQNFSYKKNDKYKKYIFDRTNVFEFLKNINITASYNKETKKYEFFKRVVKRNEYPLKADNKEKISEIRKKMVLLLKTDSLCFAYDNDLAAFKYLKGFREMCEILGVKNRVLIPFFKEDKNFKMDALNLNQEWMNDLNDIIRSYRKMLSENRTADAKKMLDSFLYYIDNDLLEDKAVFDTLRRNVKISEAIEKINRNLRRSEESLKIGKFNDAIAKIHTINNEFIEGFGYKINLHELLERNGIDFPLLIKPVNSNLVKIPQSPSMGYKK